MPNTRVASPPTLGTEAWQGRYVISCRRGTKNSTKDAFEVVALMSDGADVSIGVLLPTIVPCCFAFCRILLMVNCFLKILSITIRSPSAEIHFIVYYLHLTLCVVASSVDLVLRCRVITPLRQLMN